jgi:hypothetical protein
VRQVDDHDRDKGQAIIMLVVGISLILSLFGGILAANAIEHDPIVQIDTIDHFAYRALEAGINTFLSKANDNPNLIACNSKSTPGGQCQGGLYLNWKKVGGGTSTASVPEYYAWGNPRFCFTEVCRTPAKPTTPTPDTSKPVLYVKETIYGAAGFAKRMSYQSSTVDVKPVNGYLTRIWWSQYEATDPALSPNFNPTANPPQCTYNYANGYSGPNTTTTHVCTPVVFAGGRTFNTRIYGPIFSDDSIYITGSPTLGPVVTADPGCLFVGSNGKPCTTQQKQSTTPVVTQTATSLAGDQQGAPFERPLTDDKTLGTYASLDGCVYTGPTTIRFNAGGTMTVWSKNTPSRSKTATHPACPSTHNTAGATTNTAPVPNGTNGNGVIYVQTDVSGSCAPGASPFADYKTGTNGPNAQYTTARGTLHAAYFGAQPGLTPNCEGDAFVSDAPSAGSGIAGQLTIGAGNDVIVTGTLKYTDCGSGFASTKTHPCPLHTTGSKTNDSLGLIATNYVLVNHPVTGCASGTCSTHLAPACSTSPTVLGTPAAALCDPAKTTTPGGLTIDAAILALNHSFAVDNWTRCGTVCMYGTLKVYGSIDQKWRGAVGVVNTSGYVKDYDWNAEGSVITPPYYLSPGTPSWAIASSAIAVDPGPPKWCYTTTDPTKGVLSKFATTPACNPTA